MQRTIGSVGMASGPHYFEIDFIAPARKLGFVSHRSIRIMKDNCRAQEERARARRLQLSFLSRAVYADGEHRVALKCLARAKKLQADYWARRMRA